MQGAQRAERHQVVADKNRFRWLRKLHQSVGEFIAALDLKIAGFDQLRVNFKLRGIKSIGSAFETLVAGRERLRASDNSDTAAAQSDEMMDRQVRAAHVVYLDGISLKIQHFPVEENHRDTGVAHGR